MVGSHIKKLNAGAPPGLDGIPVPFLKHACFPIERGRRVDHVNVLVPLIVLDIGPVIFQVFLHIRSGNTGISLYKYFKLVKPAIFQQIARRVFLSKARIPACWRVAKLSPLHKKGAMSNPGNYRMIAVSGVMYRIYANLLKDMVTD
eukprot:528913-Pelagomonas_calceolata.AAC.1